jgi:long-chain acyl-CoA synthetase
LIEHCRRSLARFKVPVAIEFRTELPRTIIGKVLRRALRDEADPVPAGMQSSRKAM